MQNTQNIRSGSRRAIKNGTGIIVCLPQKFVKMAGIQRCDRLGIVYDARSITFVSRPKPEGN